MGCFSKFGVKMRVTVENKATSNIPEVRKKKKRLVEYVQLG